jgi:glycosyltransferase involved in cell wall biosynthesis
MKQSNNQKKKTLLYLNQSLSLGGAESFIIDLLIELQNLGWRIKTTAVHPHLLTMLRSHNFEVEKMPVTIDVIGDYKGLIKGIFLWVPAMFMYLLKLWRHREADVIFASGFSEKIFGSLACIILHKPIVWIEFASVQPLLQKFWNFPGFWYRLFLSYPKFIITSSQYSAEILKKELPNAANKIVVIPCGINTSSKIYPKNLSKNSQSMKPLIVCVSRLEIGKGQDLLIRSLKKVQLKYPEIRLKIVGIGDFIYSLKKLTKQLNLQKTVEFVGYVKDAKAEMKQAIISVSPSVWQLEGFGMVALESMSVGTPVITFDHGPLPEIVTHNQTGMLAESGNVDDLADKIIMLLDNPSLRSRLSASALVEVQKRFTIQAVAKKYQAYFLKTLNK